MVNGQVLLDEWRKRLQPGDRASIRIGICVWACTLEKPAFSWWREQDDISWRILYDRNEYDTEDHHSMADASELDPLPYPGMTGVLCDPPERAPRRRRRRRRKAVTA
jgi:hypothetical protein